MKASILKKLNLIIEEANAFKDKNNFQKALKKFQEALDFINNNVKIEEEKNTEIENIKNAINQTYSVQVDNVVQGAIRLTAQKKFNNAKEEFQNALKIVENIDDPNLKLAETEEINKLISENEIEHLFTNGLILKNKNQLDEAVEMFKEALSIAEEIYQSDFRNEALIRIKNEIAMIYDSQIDEIVEKGRAAVEQPEKRYCRKKQCPRTVQLRSPPQRQVLFGKFPAKSQHEQYIRRSKNHSPGKAAARCQMAEDNNVDAEHEYQNLHPTGNRLDYYCHPFHSSGSSSNFLVFLRNITVAPIIEVNSTVASPKVS